MLQLTEQEIQNIKKVAKDIHDGKREDLPEKWCVKRDEYNYQGVNLLFNSLIDPEKSYIGYSATGVRLTQDHDYIHYPHHRSKRRFNHILPGYEEITLDDIFFKLPEKWCIQITKENMDFFHNTRENGLYHKAPYYHTLGGYYSSVPDHKNCYGHSSIPEGFKEITFKQFKKYVMDTETNLKQSSINFNKQNYSIGYCRTHNVAIHVPTLDSWNKIDKLFNLRMEREGRENRKQWENYKQNSVLFIPSHPIDSGTYQTVDYAIKEGRTVIEWDQVEGVTNALKLIGYKSPIDMYRGQVKKGDIYISYDINDNLYVPKDKGKLKELTSFYSVPKEIVETWEPVYEKETLKMTIGTPSFEIEIYEDGNIKDKYNKKMTIDKIKVFLQGITPPLIPMKIGDINTTHMYNPTIQIHAPCGPTVKLSELESIVKSYNTHYKK